MSHYIYTQAKLETLGELFLRCGTHQVAGKKSNVQEGAGENYSLVVDYSWQVVPGHTRDIDNLSSNLVIVVPIYPSIVSGVFNAINQKVTVEELNLVELDRDPSASGKNKVIMTYKATDGKIVDASLDRQSNTITLVFQFEKISFDDNLTNTSGNVITTNGG